MAYNILKSKESLVDEIITFFTAQEVNPFLYAEIKEFCLRNCLRKPNDASEISAGFLSAYDFCRFMGNKNQGEYSIQPFYLEFTLEQLAQKHIILPRDSVILSPDSRRFRVSGSYARELFQKKLIKNLLFGFQYIADNYRDSVLKIENTDKNGQVDIGTGFLIHGSTPDKNLIVTNKHVVAKYEKLRLLTPDEREIHINLVFEDDKRDIALIEIDRYEAQPFYLNESTDILKEIITIGYPSIPMTKFAYQVYHKGEVNSYIEDYYDNKFFLFSAKTSSGNSGSPIIEDTGMVLGIVTEELFEKESFYTKGKLPYYAGIPTGEIVESIKDFCLKNPM